MSFVKITSAIPSTAEPGSQAAMKASDAFNCLLTTKGLPDRKILTVGIFCAFIASSNGKNFGSVALKETSFKSPSISAYGSSPKIPITTSGSLLNLPLFENSMVPPDEITASSKASYIEFTFIKSLFKFSLPCQVIVQPPV